MSSSRQQVLLLIAFFCLSSVTAQFTYQPCAARTVGNKRIVCVCNATYCDNIEPVGELRPGQAVLYYSNEAGRRLEKSNLRQTANRPDGSLLLTLNLSTTYQKMLGFGGAFTDSTGINLQTLPKSMQDNILEGYYGDTGRHINFLASPNNGYCSYLGLQYTFGRVPMASTDFSTHEYSYADVPGDFGLANFSLTVEDYQYKVF
ncbi:hypothetical protein OESDEN_05851 [Oesophagostomum dentatum]|uniref:Glucosylceramidase n=1 Tax=Oesophagostomum dentatum TaxID=61180 RepID=A0A0B1TFR3_OESDE|nr:hypothetical protein OESDEN_05851 [Oesophagostomum dentatum]